jgi:hypothetical protein
MLNYEKVQLQSTLLLCVVVGEISINQLNFEFCNKEFDFVIYCYLLVCIAYLKHYLLLFLLISDKYVTVRYVLFFIYINICWL